LLHKRMARKAMIPPRVSFMVKKIMSASVNLASFENCLFID